MSRFTETKILKQPAEPNFVKVTEIFLIPSSFLVAALGTADTHPHRALVSMLGLIISYLWWLSIREAITELDESHSKTQRAKVLCWLPVVFAAGWLFSLIAHILLWSRPLGN